MDATGAGFRPGARALAPGEATGTGPMERVTGGKRVLLVEDDTVAASALGSILGHLGCEVVVTGGVSDALRAIDLRTFDHVILDLMLPDGDGTKVLAYIRARHLPANVIIASASSDQRLLQRAKELGADGMMVKPLDLKKLLAAIGMQQGPPPG